jgi:L-alanine-DL-glutamate epimerase-like enolase superfamily enzyme
MKVATVRTHIVSCPVERPFTSARGWLYTTRASCLVEIETDDGIVGWGECYGPAAALKAVVDTMLAPRVIGRDPFDTSVVWEDLYNRVKDYGLTGLVVDAHGTWTVAEAKAFARMVEGCDLLWFEEPVSADDKAGMAEVRRSSAVPVSAGESEFTRHDFREICELRSADVLQPDRAIAGGITEAMRMGALASAFNLRLAPHLWSGAPAFAAGLHVAAAPSAGFILEYSLGHNPMLHELVEESFPVEDGMVAIPDRPGLGITIRETFLKQYGRSR